MSVLRGFAEAKMQLTATVCCVGLDNFSRRTGDNATSTTTVTTTCKKYFKSVRCQTSCRDNFNVPSVQLIRKKRPPTCNFLARSVEIRGDHCARLSTHVKFPD